MPRANVGLSLSAGRDWLMSDLIDHYDEFEVDRVVAVEMC
jgi:hypothetical protein